MLAAACQAPVAVASKPHYFCELDVVATVRNLLRSCPDFWRSEELGRSARSGSFLALDYSFMVQVGSWRAAGGRWAAGGEGCKGCC
jgi:hypothetical protein